MVEHAAMEVVEVVEVVEVDQNAVHPFPPPVNFSLYWNLSSFLAWTQQLGVQGRVARSFLVHDTKKGKECTK
jgi:hypothetical protein